MSSIGHVTDKGSRLTLRMRTCLLSITLLMVSMLTGCTKYEKYNPSPVGTYYPIQCVSNVLGREATFLMQPTTVTLCQPLKISEVGMIQYNTLDDNSKAEVARLEFSNVGVYVMTDKLRAWGRVEYSGNETVAMKAWKLWSGFYSAVWGTITIFFALVVVWVAMILLVVFSE